MAAVTPEGEILEEWEVVQVAPHFTISIKHIRAWSRMVRGTLTISILKAFGVTSGITSRRSREGGCNPCCHGATGEETVFDQTANS